MKDIIIAAIFGGFYRSFCISLLAVVYGVGGFPNVSTDKLANWRIVRGIRAGFAADLF